MERNTPYICMLLTITPEQELSNTRAVVAVILSSPHLIWVAAPDTVRIISFPEHAFRDSTAPSEYSLLAAGVAALVGQNGKLRHAVLPGVEESGTCMTRLFKLAHLPWCVVDRSAASAAMSLVPCSSCMHVCCVFKIVQVPLQCLLDASSERKTVGLPGCCTRACTTVHKTNPDEASSLQEDELSCT